MASRKVINAGTTKEQVFEDLKVQHEARLLKAINQLELEIIGLASQLKTSNGLLLTDTANLQSAFNMRSDIVGIFEKEYATIVTQTVKEFDEMAIAVKDYLKTAGISATFTEADVATITALKQGAFARLDVLGKTFQNTLADEIYTSTISGRAFTDMVASLKGALVGLEDIGGTPMAVHAKTLAHDALVGMDRSISAKKAEEAGIENFLYFGSIVEGSRDFCLLHEGETRTKEEWEEIGLGDWQGKSSSDLFATAGGYNCGHTLVPVPTEAL